MKKIIYLVVGIIIVGLGIFFFFRDTFAPSVEGPTGSTPFSPPTTSPPSFSVPTGDTLTLGTARGSVVVKNFYASAVRIEEELSVIMRETDDYIIEYSRADSSFSVTVLRAPAVAVRNVAEKDFLAILGIQQNEACLFKASVIVPLTVDAPLSGAHPLSFCVGTL